MNSPVIFAGALTIFAGALPPCAPPWWRGRRKAIFDFLLVINTNFHPILHHFQVIADYLSYLLFRHGVFLFSTPIQGESLKLMTMEFDLKKPETSLCCVVQSVFRYLEPFRHGSW